MGKRDSLAMGDNEHGLRLIRKKSKWIVSKRSPKTVDDLSFTSRDPQGRISWWDVQPPNTNYWHVHQMLGRAYAFEVLDLINNPEAEKDNNEHILAFIATTMMGKQHSMSACALEGMTHGFFEAISEYIVTGTADR